MHHKAHFPRVVRARTTGMCFGVRQALAAAEALDRPTTATIHGAFVHDEAVNAGLVRLGFRVTDAHDRPPTRDVVVPVHGVSERERRRLLAADRRLVDLTCPLVRVVHDAARELHRRGYFVVVIGKRGHPEIDAVTDDLSETAVVQTLADVRTFPGERIGIVCQSTMPPDHVRHMHRAIEAAHPGRPVRFVDTVCAPTRARQAAVLALLPCIDALVVVGSRRSHNARQLVRLARIHAMPAFRVAGAGHLRADLLDRFPRIGLAAGASVPDATVDAVETALRRIVGLPAR